MKPFHVDLRVVRRRPCDAERLVPTGDLDFDRGFDVETSDVKSIAVLTPAVRNALLALKDKAPHGTEVELFLNYAPAPTLTMDVVCLDESLAPLPDIDAILNIQVEAFTALEEAWVEAALDQTSLG